MITLASASPALLFDGAGMGHLGLSPAVLCWDLIPPPSCPSARIAPFPKLVRGNKYGADNEGEICWVRLDTSPSNAA